MDVKLTAALIAGAVSVVGAVLTYVSADRQLKSKLQELEQAQLKEILDARIKAYPRLWRIFQAQVSNWRIEGKPANGEWAKRLFEGLNSYHSMYGVFFSQPVYESFCEVRAAAAKLSRDYTGAAAVPPEALEELDAIWSGRGKPGLATQLKDDLGSYRSTLISARKSTTT